ncbi:Dipeptidyl peptidase 4 [Oleoguttula sp. CCFEE 5521]
MRAQLLTCLLAVCTSSVAINDTRQPHQPLGNGSKLLTYNDTVISPKFSASSQTVSWIASETDGEVIYQGDDSALILENYVTGTNRTFVSSALVPNDTHEYWVSSDQQRVLFATNYTKQYRYSYFADYFVLDVTNNKSTPLVPDQVGDIQYAEFAPTGNAIAFVRGNNLFVMDGNATRQITNDGGPDLFHAVPDWVYEEEIFGSRSTLWWSPDAQFLAFLSFNETGVGTFTIPYYMDNQRVAPAYPRELDLRYPKVGTTNPTVSLSVLDIGRGSLSGVPVTAFGPDDLIIGEVGWVTDDHAALIYRAFNRVQDLDKHIIVNVPSMTSSTSRERDGTDGWLDNNIAIQYLGSIDSASNTTLPARYNNTGTSTSNATWYIDLSDISGWNHIHLFPVLGGTSIALTSGEWEVTAILKVDTTRQLIYFASTKRHSTERHLYSVNYVTKETTPIVDDTTAAYYIASFSASGAYYLLSYQGPNVPYQELYSTNSTIPLRTITSNSALVTRIADYALPNITYFELSHSSGYTLNVMQRLPPNFNASKTYPVLFTPYGGPGAQEVTKRFQALTFRAYIASDPELEYITYTIDNRGTGYKGRAFRSTVASQLGKLESEDQVWAAEQLLSRFSFLDADRMGMWGWSFGGYLTAKVIELNSGVFSLGLITAPVSDWRFYDSMYTERYMKTLSANAAGYNETAVWRSQGFKDVSGGVAIMHGTGDDNVHYQNSAALLDLLVGDGVSPEKLEWAAFTDSDHSIAYHGAGQWLYKFLTKRLHEEKHRVIGDRLVHQWSRRGEVELADLKIV